RSVGSVGSHSGRARRRAAAARPARSPERSCARVSRPRARRDRRRRLRAFSWSRGVGCRRRAVVLETVARRAQCARRQRAPRRLARGVAGTWIARLATTVRLAAPARPRRLYSGREIGETRSATNTPMPTNLIHPDDAALSAEPVVALATLVGATGSTSKKLGAKMIVGASGRLIGGVTIGGCVDAQVIEAADALVAGTADRRLLSISLDDDEAWEIGLTCGGTVDVLLQRVRPNDASDPVVAAHRRAVEMVERGESAVIVTPLDAGEMHTVGEDEAPDAAAGERVFLDRIAPPMTLVIVGAGHIAMSLTTLARELDMHTVIVDGRGRYATRERFPFADEIRVGMPSEIVATIRPTARVAVVLVAHDYKYDLPVLRALLRSP